MRARVARRGLAACAGLFALGLNGCHPHVSRAEAFTEAGWHGEACFAAARAKVPPQAVLDAHLAGAPRVAGGLLTRAELAKSLGNADIGTYGSDWLLGQVLLDERDPRAPMRRVELHIERGGERWTACPASECTDTWTADRLGLPRQAPKPGGVLRGLGGLFALGGAMMLDLLFAPIRGLQAITGDEVLPWMSADVVAWMGEGSPNQATAAALRLLPTESGRCGAGSACSDRWVVRAAPAEAGAAGDTLSVTWTWEHGDCRVEADWRLPLAAEVDVAAAVANTLSPGVALDATPPTAWRVYVVD